MKIPFSIRAEALSRLDDPLTYIIKLMRASEPRLRAHILAQAVIILTGAADVLGESIDELAALIKPCGHPGCDCHERYKKVVDALRDRIAPIARETFTDNNLQAGAPVPFRPIYPKKQ